MAKQKKEVAVINFEEFSIAQLPELNGKKEEIKSIIDANPVVEVIDNASYELAKKSRTAVKTLRTSLEKEKKEVNDRIKKNVLEVVANEYDSLIADVKNSENARQEHVTSWEEKKEAERLEKLRLEEERVLRIKKSISDFFNDWTQKINELTFSEIDSVEIWFGESLVNYDKESLQEYEVLFNDNLSSLTYSFSQKKATLIAEENIRLEQIRLAEERKKQEEESKKLAEQMRIERERYLQEQKLKYEEIRIAQEKFQKEKAEFEAKKAEAKFQERKKFLVDEDYWRIYLLAECGESESTARFNLLRFSDSEFEDFKLAVLKSKEPSIETKEVEFEEPATENYHEEDIHEIAKPKEELTWELIHDSFVEETEIDDSINFFYWLKENYNVPTPKN